MPELSPSTLSRQVPPFVVSTMLCGESGVVTVSGDLDDLAVNDLEQATALVLFDRIEVLLIDLTATTFLSTSGMSALIAAHESLQAMGGKMIVVASGSATARQLRLAGVTDTLEVVETVDTAIGHGAERLFSAAWQSPPEKEPQRAGARP
ncbi:hypothetical protein BH683_017945 [Williamsia sp. 1138]|nr:hypothetical protein BH683_017945 [Williamsia sp. 1138]